MASEFGGESRSTARDGHGLIEPKGPARSRSDPFSDVPGAEDPVDAPVRPSLLDQLRVLALLILPLALGLLILIPLAVVAVVVAVIAVAWLMLRHLLARGRGSAERLFRRDFEGRRNVRVRRAPDDGPTA